MATPQRSRLREFADGGESSGGRLVGVVFGRLRRRIDACWLLCVARICRGYRRPANRVSRSVRVVGRRVVDETCECAAASVQPMLGGR